MPVLCEGTSRMTRAASDCTSEHERNYFDSRLMCEMAILRQLRNRTHYPEEDNAQTRYRNRRNESWSTD